MPITEPESWANAWSTAVETVQHKFFSSLMTCLMLCGMFILYSSIQQGSFFEGVRTIFTSYETRAKEQALARADRLQAEIVAAKDSNLIIQDTLKALLDGESNDAIRVRLFAFHNGETLLNSAPVMRYDIVAGYAERGRSVGELESNLPLNNFASTLPELVAGKCKLINVNDLVDTGAKLRMQILGIVGSLTCPVHDGRGHLLGALGVSWDEPNHLEQRLDVTIARTQAAADKIGLIYSLLPKSIELKKL